MKCDLLRIIHWLTDAFHLAQKPCRKDLQCVAFFRMSVKQYSAQVPGSFPLLCVQLTPLKVDLDFIEKQIKMYLHKSRFARLCLWIHVSVTGAHCCNGMHPTESQKYAYVLIYCTT
jgi:hypothetical protein